MKKILTLLLCGVLVLSLAACGGKEPDNTPAPTEPTEDVGTKIYVDDPTVNRFINDLYDRSDLQLLGTSRGTEEGQYILYANDCEIVASAHPQGLYLDICGGKTEKGLERAISLFRYFAKIADSSANDARLNEAIAKMGARDSSFGNHRVSNYVKILRYISLSSEPTVSVDCHIEMLLMNYLPIEEEEE
ncbi:MAG: hypothetical protein IIX28_02645 [Clostridia bacterium]|nr:hypothetical protein [Clostridia bacterium]